MYFKVIFDVLGDVYKYYRSHTWLQERIRIRNQQGTAKAENYFYSVICFLFIKMSYFIECENEIY